MYSIYEKALLDTPASQFPLLAAAQSLYKNCNKCGHKNVNVHAALKLAVHKYKNDKQFKDHCASLFRLPCAIAGVLVD